MKEKVLYRKSVNKTQGGGTFYVNETHPGGGAAVFSSKNGVMFNNILGTTLGVNGESGYTSTPLTAFGDTAESQPSILNPQPLFTGKPHVDGLGHAFLMRNYRAGLGKWLTADPLGYPDGWNQLAYCGNNSTEAFDWQGCRTEIYTDTSNPIKKNVRVEDWTPWEIMNVSSVGPYTVILEKRTGKEYCDLWVNQYELTYEDWLGPIIGGAIGGGIIGGAIGGVIGAVVPIIVDGHEVETKYIGQILYQERVYVRDVVEFRVRITE